VAKRIARSSRKEAARRAAREARFAANAPIAAPAVVKAEGLEIASLVRTEVDHLSQADQLLLRWTYWQGKTYEEVADLLSWPIGTVRSRLARIRDRLRNRLARRGFAPSVGVTGSASPVNETLILKTVRVAIRSATGISAAVEAGAVPATVAALVKGELSAMSLISWKSIAAALILGGSMTAGVAALALPGSDKGAPEPGKPAVRSESPATTIVLAAQEKARKESPAKTSLLTNGSVEEGEKDAPRAWNVGAAIPGVEYLWSRTGHTGKASLCLKKTAIRYFPIGQWTQEFDRQGTSPRLKVAAWIKADHVTKAILDAQFLDGKGKWSHAWVVYIGAKQPRDRPWTHDWKRYEGIVEIPPDTKQIIIAPQIYGPGQVWFDDLDAEYTEDPATKAVDS
jgi:RNA polymerase sigma-70 factor (ECF subfamily)